MWVLSAQRHHSCHHGGSLLPWNSILYAKEVGKKLTCWHWKDVRKTWRVLTSISCLGLLWETSGPTQTVSASPSVLFCIIVSRIHFLCTDFSFTFPFPFWTVPVPSHFPFDIPPPKKKGVWVRKGRKLLVFWPSMFWVSIVIYAFYCIICLVLGILWLCFSFFRFSFPPFLVVWEWGVF